jgi:hypothetical protein
MSDQKTIEYFSAEIVHQRARALIAFAQVERECMSAHPNIGAIHADLQTVIEALAHIQRMFYPKGWDKTQPLDKVSVKRAKLLRDWYSLVGKSLPQLTEIRNAIAHSEDRVDTWMEKSTDQNFGRHMLGNIRDLNKHDIKNEDVLGMYDPETTQYVFNEHTVSIERAMSEANALVLIWREHFGAQKALT